jgi:hypothetical protein
VSGSAHSLRQLRPPRHGAFAGLRGSPELRRARVAACRSRNMFGIAHIRRIALAAHAVSSLNQSAQLLQRTSAFFAEHGFALNSCDRF